MNGMADVVLSHYYEGTWHDPQAHVFPPLTLTFMLSLFSALEVIIHSVVAAPLFLQIR